MFASGQAYVTMSRVRTRHDLFIEDWSPEGLLNVKHAIRTRLTKESEDDRTAIDDKIDELEERMADGSKTEVEDGDHRLEIEVVERWESIRNIRARLADRLYDSDDRASNRNWNSDGDLSDGSSMSVSNLSSSYESDVESVSRAAQEPEPSTGSECGGDGESDRAPDEEARLVDGSSDAVVARVEESAIGKILSGTGFSTIRSEKRKHDGTSDSGSDESNGPTG
ncbi:hypothetical protein BGX29_003321, partial [Mortierella sp. GBA35]